MDGALFFWAMTRIERFHLLINWATYVLPGIVINNHAINLQNELKRRTKCNICIRNIVELKDKAA